MRFHSEKQLVDAFQTIYGPTGSAWVWIREFGTSGGVADIVAAKLGRSHNENNPLSQLAARWAYTLRSLPCASEFTVDHVANLANVSYSRARGILRGFGDSGFCERVKNADTWLKKVEPEPIANEIVAVEAKLSNWRRALYQAYQHGDYATRTWVLIDGDSIGGARLHVDEFESRGVGLAGLWTDGQVEVVYSAPKRMPRVPYRFWHANVEIAKRIEGTSSP
jgi:hypothetical protein